MRKIVYAILGTLTIAMMLAGCSSVRQAVAMKDCNYSFNKIGEVSFMGIGKTDTKRFEVNPLSIAAAMAGASTTMPLKFTLFLNVENPNRNKAAVEGLAYKVMVSDVLFAEGKMTKSFSVGGGQTGVISLPIDVDVRTLVNGEHRAVMVNLIMSMLGVPSSTSKVQVKIKPTVRMRSSTMTSPSFIPVTFEYGGK